MREEIIVTPKPELVTTTGKQPLTEVRDVSAYTRLDLGLQVFIFDNPGDITVVIETSLQNTDDSDTQWATLCTFALIDAANTLKVASATTGILRYIRWRITSFNGTSPKVVFSITGFAVRD
jgi:hypothetical protein